MDKFIDILNNIEKARQHLIDRIKENNKNPRDYQFFYRGDDPDVPLVPSIYAKELVKYEHLMINEILSSNPEDFIDKPFMIDKLAMMQHYGLPTRLLDVTTSPLIALFFACGREQLKETITKTIHVLAIPNNFVKPWNSDTVSILSNIANVTKEKIDEDIERAMKKASEDEKDSIAKAANRVMNDRSSDNFNLKTILGYFFSLDKYNKEYGTRTQQINAAIEKYALFEYITSFIHYEKPSFKNLIKIEDLDNRIVCVLPRSNNRRLVAQKGAFLLFGIKGFNKEECANIDLKSDIIYNTSFKPEVDASIQEQLTILGIDSSTLFPDIYDRAYCIKNKYLKLQGTQQ